MQIKEEMFNQEERALTNAMDAEAERRNADEQRTPGEWIFSKYSPYDYGVYSQDGNGNDIALVREYGSQGAANAAFICKAVNNHDALLEALKEAYSIIERMSDEYSEVANKHASFTNGESKRIIAAIQKAQ